jgi:hypothetical protein
MTLGLCEISVGTLGTRVSDLPKQAFGHGVELVQTEVAAATRAQGSQTNTWTGYRAGHNSAAMPQGTGSPRRYSVTAWLFRRRWVIIRGIWLTLFTACLWCSGFGYAVILLVLAHVARAYRDAMAPTMFGLPPEPSSF